MIPSIKAKANHERHRDLASARRRIHTSPMTLPIPPLRPAWVNGDSRLDDSGANRTHSTLRRPLPRHHVEIGADHTVVDM
jgi:hypothetical protein